MRTWSVGSGVFWAVVFWALCIPGCEDQDSTPNDNNISDDDNTDSTDSDEGIDTEWDSDIDTEDDNDSDTGDVCFEEDAEMDIVPTRVMLLIDNSSSMLDPADGSPKWEQARDAAIAAIEPWIGSQSIEFGLDFFPDIEGGECEIDDPVFIDTSKDAAGEIVTYLKDTFVVDGDGSTPLCFEMHKFSTDPGYAPVFTEPGFDRYLVLVSDGEDTCWMSQLPPQAPCDSAFDWALQVTGVILDAGIKSYAIGFGFSGNAQVLDDIMKYGGTGLTEHIEVSNGAALQAELEKIAQEVVSCTFDFVPDVDVNFDEINVYADGVVVPFDENCHNGAGWDWGDDAKTQIILCPKACDNLKKGVWKIITATAGCPVVIIE